MAKRGTILFVSNRRLISKEFLIDLYLKKGRSIKDIARVFGCSNHKVRYWMERYLIITRSISEAIYLKNNPDGDPFVFKNPVTLHEALLFGYGMGLYWGEGTKADKTSVRLGNTDPVLILKFVEFLVKCFGVALSDFKFGLQLFNDVSEQEALDFWVKSLKIKKSQFYKVVRTISGSIGTYRKKSRYGVLTVYYHNKKLRDLLVSFLPM
mgnify:CR=1 FL=1